ncbi:hypothetical protein RUND412_004387 [Rhizina undulata]
MCFLQSLASSSEAVRIEDSLQFLKCVFAIENMKALINTPINTSMTSTTLQNPFFAPSLFLAARVLCTRYLDFLHRSGLSPGESSDGTAMDRDISLSNEGSSQPSSTFRSANIGTDPVPPDVELFLLAFYRIKEVWPALTGKYTDLTLIGLRTVHKTFARDIKRAAN